MKTLNFLLICIIFSLTLTSKEIFAFSKEEKLNKLALIEQLKSKGEIVYAILPKNTNEPFFQIVAKGCDQTAKKFGVNCIFYGTSHENMRNQVKDILDLIKVGIDGIAISSVKKGYISSIISEKINEWGKPVISFDSPLSSKISKSYIGTNNYLLGKALGDEIRKLKPNGGTYCIQTERPDSPNHNDRMKGILDGITKNGIDNNIWKNIPRCPQKTMGNFERGINQMSAILTLYKVDVFANTGGGPQFLPKLYRKTMEAYKKDIKSGKLIFANIDTVPVQLEYLKEGISTVNVGQKPYEMGAWSVKVLQMLSSGEEVPLVINTGLTFCTKKNVEICTD